MGRFTNTIIVQLYDFKRQGWAIAPVWACLLYTSVSLRLQVDIRRAAETDDVADTVSYADVHTAVKAEMDIPSKLLEHVCGRIINRLFHDFPQIEEITLKLAKRNPPMGADIEAAGVEICQRRGE